MASPVANSSGISPRPVRVRKDASPGQENEPGNTIDRSAHSIAERFGRRVHPRAKSPDRVVPWVLRLLRSSHPPRHEGQCSREGAGPQRTRSTMPTLFTPLQAIYTRPSAVAAILRTTPPPEGMAARANCSFFGFRLNNRVWFYHRSTYVYS